MSVAILKRLFTVDEYYQMGQNRIFSEDDRVELIEGEIMQMTPIGSRHAGIVAHIEAWFHRLLESRATIWVQNPIRLDEYSEPEPDLALLKPRHDFYKGKHPQSDEVFLVVEVADTSIDYDRDVKIPLYARYGIPEVWIVDMNKERIETYRNPSSRGYEKIQSYHSDQILSPQAFPNLVLTPKEILG